ncbi:MULTISPECIES: flagellar biosynthetic protein FliR [Sphingomonadales]|uniref:Flagellar biosynthetic protein FliR n=2 Tax=Edaphosphingomonas TaxID=3423724 RepID=A0A2T4I778_9SPHN|nr:MULTISPECIES: flagellar biosynthetic protein FliR [Sphingomonas]AGH49042.1 flagellar biosynthesis protein FliR [Sphingomonas sp. MM-1]MDX3885292.1 flagellar biosynthetic protein FliR [Sphingomonas sp.]OHT21464.1 flagellar biosynthesis protein FliR [Sphingomonas haloaromaticamans]PTD26946.1 flagellar biosynthetic protein FliR [Sphingomonas fennica]
MAGLPFDAAAFLILFARIGAVLMLLPAFSEDAIPGRVRLLFGLGFTAGLFGLLGGQVAPALRSDTALPGIVLSELLVGIAMGMIVRILFNAASMAGAIISLQVGLSSALVMDPALGGQASVLARFIGIAAAVVCLTTGVHHLWIAAMVQSYALFPVGGLPPAADFARLAVETTGHAMGLAVSMAAPLIVYGILFNVALGLAVRMAPQIQAFFIMQPLNILLGMSLFAVLIGGILTAFANAMANFMQNGWSL